MLRCIECGRSYEEDEVVYRCECGGLLEVVVDLSRAEDVFDGRDIRVWKYESFLPVRRRVSLEEGEPLFTGSRIYSQIQKSSSKTREPTPQAHLRTGG